MMHCAAHAVELRLAGKSAASLHGDLILTAKHAGPESVAPESGRVNDVERDVRRGGGGDDGVAVPKRLVAPGKALREQHHVLASRQILVRSRDGTERDPRIARLEDVLDVKVAAQRIDLSHVRAGERIA